MKPFFKISVNDVDNISASNIQVAPKENKADGIFIFDGFEVEQSVQNFADSCVVQQSNTIINTGNKPLTINRFSSAFVDNIAVNYHNHDVRIHYCQFCWQGEGQWVSCTPYEMGVYPVAYHVVGRSAKGISSIGSWSTNRYYPILIIEDKTLNKSWFFEHEGGFSWDIEIGTQGKPENAELTVDINALNENTIGTAVVLQPGEQFETSTALYGEVDGNLENAINELLSFKRKHGKRLETPLVCFNDYMNCLWAKPSAEKLIPLIDAASEVGSEIFCIDAGWYFDRDGCTMGDWIENDELFPGYGLKGIIEYIIQKGMKPGLWFEIETFMSSAAIANIAPNAVLKRRGNTIEPSRGYLNFECEKVCNYLVERVRYFYNMGVRYIKNDYNHTLGIGCDGFGSSYGYGIIRNYRAFINLIDKLKKEMPDLIIENCGSGGMRCDNGTLKHFELQSTSDQERYYNNPSILWGMMRLMPPEKCGIWAYPYPLVFDNISKDMATYTDEYKEQMADGRETIYNMACTLFGIPFLSGHIHQCDEFNRKLIKDAVSVYKKDRDFISNATPVSLYPQQALFSEGYSVLALKTNKKLRFGIFKFGDVEKLTLDLRNYIGNNPTLSEIYPAIENESYAVLNNGILTFDSEYKITAHVYEINFE